MKKVLILLLALSMVFTFAACREKPDDPTPSGTNPPTNAPTDAPTDAPSDTPSDAPSDVPSDAPVVTPPEPTPDEKVAAIKNEVLKLLSDDEKDTRKSPAALLESLEKDFAIKNIVRTAGGNTNLPFPTSIVQKDGSSVKVFEDETYYTFTHKDIVMYIMQATGEEPDLYHCERSEEYYSSLFYAFGLDLSLLFGSVGELPDDEEVEIDFPLLTADDLTVSEDFTTCTISEAYLKKLLGSALKSYNYTDADIEALFLNFEGSGVYTVAEKKLVFNLSAETEKTGPVTLYIMVQDHLESHKPKRLITSRFFVH